MNWLKGKAWATIDNVRIKEAREMLESKNHYTPFFYRLRRHVIRNSDNIDAVLYTLQLALERLDTKRVPWQDAVS